VVVELSQETLGPVSERTLETVGEAAYAATENAHSDIVADRAYRRALARVFATRATRAAANHAG
jgi:CO/xanthine dehydrogenase FAD-binding subunit